MIKIVTAICSCNGFSEKKLVNPESVSWVNSKGAKKNFLGIILLSIVANFTHAGCPEGQQEASGMSSLQYHARFKGSEEYSACLSIDNPDANNDRESWGLTQGGGRTFQCGDITVKGLTIRDNGNIEVKSSVGFLRFVGFIDQDDDRNSLPTLRKAFCKNANCFEIWSKDDKYINQETKKILQLRRDQKLIYQGCAAVTF